MQPSIIPTRKILLLAIAYLEAACRAGRNKSALHAVKARFRGCFDSLQGPFTLGQPAAGPGAACRPGPSCGLVPRRPEKAGGSTHHLPRYAAGSCAAADTLPPSPLLPDRLRQARLGCGKTKIAFQQLSGSGIKIVDSSHFGLLLGCFRPSWIKNTTVNG